MSEDWRSDDAFADPGDPAAREREERRREREQKRQQKAAKQAEKEASKAPPPEPVKPAEPPKPARTPEEEFWDEDPPTPEPQAAAPAPAPAAGAKPADPQPAGGEERSAAAAAAGAAAAAARAEAGEVTPEPAREQTWEHEYEPRQAPAEDWGFHEEGDPAMKGGASGRGGGPRGIVGALMRHPFRVIAGIVAILFFWFLWSLFQPFHGDGSGKVALTIPKGASVSEVGDLLEKKGVIDDSTFFQIRVTLAGERSDLYAGHFTLKHDMSYGSAIDALSQPPAKSGIVTVTIPEGYTRSQAAQLAREDGLTGSYMKETVKSKYLDPAAYGGKRAKNLEGFLFPDTFELKRQTPVANLVQLQLEDFKRRIGGVDMKYAKSKNLTIYDVLTIASIVEHEAGLASQRKDVAAVIYNRLREGMTLGSDATVRFATSNFTKPLTQSELESESPYNTRNHTGLPPGPIGNPGLAAIEAAAHPAKVPYLFFVTSPDCKKLNFAKTEAEFERDVERYEASNCGE